MERFYDRVRALFGGKLTAQQVDGLLRARTLSVASCAVPPFLRLSFQMAEG